MAAHINHVSINASDLEASIGFYAELLGAQRIPSPNFGREVAWLQLGPTQLHLFQSDATPGRLRHHLGITVDDLEPVYRAAERWDAFDDDAFRGRMIELPGDVVQLYVRDPSGNLVEIDHRGVDRLPDDIRAQVRGLWELNEQTDEQMAARLLAD